MGETDLPFKAFIKNIKFGKYTPPCAHTCLSELTKIAIATELKVRATIDKYQAEGLMVSISTDIWGEDGRFCFSFLVNHRCGYYVYNSVCQNYLSLIVFYIVCAGKSLLALFVHLIDDNFEMQDLLILAKPFSEVSHTAEEIQKAIKIGLASYGIGKYDNNSIPRIDTVRKCINIDVEDPLKLNFGFYA